MSLTSIDAGKEFKVFSQQAAYGILNKFTIETGASLNPDVNPGQVLTPKGIRWILNADFDTIGPAEDGLITDDDRTAVFWSLPDETIYVNLTGTPSNPGDLYLGALVAASGSITAWIPGCIANERLITTPILTLGTAADLWGGTFPGINGGPGRLYSINAHTTTTVVGTTEVLTVSKVNIVTGAETALGTISIAAKTLDVDAVANVEYSNFADTDIDAAIVNPGDMLVIATGGQGDSGACIVNMRFAGPALR